MMDPRLKPYFDHVLVLFWPVLVWNLVRIARWQACTGQDGLWAVNCFGGVRLVRVSDAPRPAASRLPHVAQARLDRLTRAVETRRAPYTRLMLARMLARRLTLTLTGPAHRPAPAGALPLPLPLPDT